MDKTILLASFVYIDKVDSFIDYLTTQFNIEKTKIFGFKLPSDDSKIVITFRITLIDGIQINLKDYFQNAVVIHKRGLALYTINALNELIKTKIGDNIGNIDMKTVKIDWAEYQEKLILVDNGELNLFDIKRVF